MGNAFKELIYCRAQKVLQGIDDEDARKCLSDVRALLNAGLYEPVLNAIYAYQTNLYTTPLSFEEEIEQVVKGWEVRDRHDYLDRYEDFPAPEESDPLNFMKKFYLSGGTTIEDFFRKKEIRADRYLAEVYDFLSNDASSHIGVYVERYNIGSFQEMRIDWAERTICFKYVVGMRALDVHIHVCALSDNVRIVVPVAMMDAHYQLFYDLLGRTQSSNRYGGFSIDFTEDGIQLSYGILFSIQEELNKDLLLERIGEALEEVLLHQNSVIRVCNGGFTPVYARLSEFVEYLTHLLCDYKKVFQELEDLV